MLHAEGALIPGRHWERPLKEYILKGYGKSLLYCLTVLGSAPYGGSPVTSPLCSVIAEQQCQLHSSYSHDGFTLHTSYSSIRTCVITTRHICTIYLPITYLSSIYYLSTYLPSPQNLPRTRLIPGFKDGDGFDDDEWGGKCRRRL